MEQGWRVVHITGFVGPVDCQISNSQVKRLVIVLVKLDPGSAPESTPRILMSLTKLKIPYHKSVTLTTPSSKLQWLSLHT